MVQERRAPGGAPVGRDRAPAGVTTVTRRVLLLAAGLLAAVWLCGRSSPAQAADQPKCDAPADLIDDEPRLDGLAQHFKDHKPITIVAVGGASTAGKAAGNNADYAWPHRLQEILQKRHPDTPIAVINKGVAGQTTRDMIDRFATDVFGSPPTLVIWETGTVDAVHGTDIEEFAADLHAGIAALRQHDSELILMDMQYNPSPVSFIDYQPYLDTLRQVGDLDTAYVFRRFDIMKYWSENGVFDFVDVPQAQRTSLAVEVYDCLAERLADAIDHATAPQE
jgi:lysophospholipase L1-like esterase